MKPYESVNKINMNKHDLMLHIRMVASNCFNSAKTVIDNMDTSLGIIQIGFSVDLPDVWGTPLCGANWPGSRAVHIKYNIYIKDSAFKVENSTFELPSQEIIDNYTVCAGKTQDDFNKLQETLVNNFCNKIKSEVVQSDKKWDF